MTKTFTPPFAQDPHVLTAVVTGAVSDLNTDTQNGTELLLTAGENGAIVTRLSAIPRGTVTATGLLLFHSSDDGVTKRLIDSVTMAAQVVSTAAAINKTFFTDYSEMYPLRLGPNERLYVGSQVAQAVGIVFKAEVSEF